MRQQEDAFLAVAFSIQNRAILTSLVFHKGFDIYSEVGGNVANIPEDTFMFTPFCIAMVAKGRQRSQNLTLGIPALGRTSFSILLTLSKDM